MPSYEFDAIIIGGGAAGLTASGIAANVGAKTLMIESNKLGGDCTWTGCVPSKVILKAAKIAQQIRTASKFGLIDIEPTINFRKLIEHVHKIRDEVYWDADRPRFMRKWVSKWFLGRPRLKIPMRLKLLLMMEQREW